MLLAKNFVQIPAAGTKKYSMALCHAVFLWNFRYQAGTGVYCFFRG